MISLTNTETLTFFVDWLFSRTVRDTFTSFWSESEPKCMRFSKCVKTFFTLSFHVTCVPHSDRFLRVLYETIINFFLLSILFWQYIIIANNKIINYTYASLETLPSDMLQVQFHTDRNSFNTVLTDAENIIDVAFGGGWKNGCLWPQDHLRFDFTIGPVCSQDQESYSYIGCSGFVGIGLHAVTGELVGILTHHTGNNPEEYIPLLTNSLLAFDLTTLNGGIFGGRVCCASYAEKLKQSYAAHDVVLNELAKKWLQRENICMIGSPKYSSHQTHVYLCPKKRIFHIYQQNNTQDESRKTSWPLETVCFPIESQSTIFEYASKVSRFIH